MTGGIRFQGAHLTIDGHAAADLAESHGTPLYLYSGEVMAAACRQIGEAFPGGVRICYAVKANGLRAILRFLAEEGCGFDLVSGGEMVRLEAAGLGACERVFDGVGKEAWEVERAMSRPGLLFLNLESLAEAEMLARVGRRLGRPVPVALRLTLEIAAGSHVYLNTSLGREKFGLAPEEALEAARLAAVSPWLEPVGCHLHLGSLLADPEPYLEAIRRALEFADRAGLDLRFLDIGGGFAPSLAHGGQAFPFDRLGPPLAGLLAGRETELVVEPGRFLVGPAGLLLTRVIRVKERGRRRFLIVDGAMNDFIRPSLYGGEHLVWPVASGPPPVGEIPAGRTDVTGPVCESGDFLARDRALPDLAAGDLLALFCAGAYGSAMASRYNSRRLPAEVILAGGEPRLARQRDDFSDLWEREL